MASDLHILGRGAVTAVGLDAAQTCAAIRAGIKRFSPIAAQLLDHEEPPVGAPVSADPRLRASDRKWLLALTARALAQCSPTPETALIWQVPEPHRQHPLTVGIADDQLLAELVELLLEPLSPHSRVVHSGAAGLVEGLALARELIAAGEVRQCVIGGADSLLRKLDLDNLARDQRLLGPGKSQGLVPGEGAAFVVVGPRESNELAIRGLGIGYERNPVIGSEPSVGDAFVQAFEAAIHDAGVKESEIGFVAGNFNGERYDAWELSHAQARCYQTRRDRLPTIWPAKSTGEIGVAGGALALIAAEHAIVQGYGAGSIATVQLRSEGELRGIAVLRVIPPLDAAWHPVSF